MEKFVNMAFKLLLIVIICTSASAEDTRNEKTENIRDGAYLDIGLGARYKSDPFIYDEDNNGSGLALYVNGRYQKNGLFLEFLHGTSKQ